MPGLLSKGQLAPAFYSPSRFVAPAGFTDLRPSGNVSSDRAAMDLLFVIVYFYLHVLFLFLHLDLILLLTFSSLQTQLDAFSDLTLGFIMS